MELDLDLTDVFSNNKYKNIYTYISFNFHQLLSNCCVKQPKLLSKFDSSSILEIGKDKVSTSEGGKKKTR